MTTPKLPQRWFRACLSAVLFCLASNWQPAHAQNTAVNYLGNLTGISGPVTGTYDFKFRLFEKESGSPQLGNTVFQYNVPVQNGSFAVSLDFGIVLLPITYFIEVSVKPSGPGDFVLLLPLQKFSPFATAQTADVANLATYANTSGSSGTSGYATNAGSAGYANISGTAGYANNAGTATYATNAANSGYATNAGSAVFATNSFYSSFATNSGYATNAGYANTSGTAGFATNAGHANTSGTSGYATNAGYANTSGTSVFATNAGYANTAGVAVLASNVAPNSVGTVALQDNSVTGSKIPPGTVVRSLNTLTDHVLLEPGPNIFITSTNQTLTVSASAAVGGSGWGFAGNTIAGPDFLGTLNPEALEFRVNGLRALHLSPNEESPNVLGGSFANEITNEIVGVVIAGGGNTNGPQRALGSYAFIGGGWSNSAASLAVVAGGLANQAGGSNSVVVGGSLNQAVGLGSVVAGGTSNRAEGSNSVVAGGWFNQASGSSSVVAGGGRDGYYAAEWPFAYYPAEPNTAAGHYSAVSGGSSNIAALDFSNVGGGRNNAAWGEGAVVGGGMQNTATNLAVVAGGWGNQATGSNSVVAGGVMNTAAGVGSVISGGGQAEVSFPYSEARPNLAAGDYSAIGGGRGNSVLANNAVVAGGLDNEASGENSVVPGGFNNVASGFGSLAAGMNALAMHDHSFVWSDGQTPHVQTTDPNQFVVDAAGGLHLANDTGLSFAGEGQLIFGGSDRVLVEFPGTTGGIGVDVEEVFFTTAGSFAWFQDEAWPPGAALMRLDDTGLTVNGTFVSASDRNLKTNVQPVNPQEILARVAELPIARWSYQHNAGTTHVGPMAQDFHAAFGVGPDDRHIAMVDADGVALAAIQGLNQKVERREQRAEGRIQKLEAENAELKSRLEKLEQLLADKLNGGAQ